MFFRKLVEKTMDLKTRKRRHPGGRELDSSDVISYFQKSNDGKHDLCLELFEKCPATLLSRIKATASLVQKRDFILDLSQEISTKILRYLDNSDLIACQQVCKRWRKAVIDLPFIQLICQRLDVNKSEYGTQEQAIAICQNIMSKRKSSFDDWFINVPYETTDMNLIDVDFEIRGDILYIIKELGLADEVGVGFPKIISVACIKDIENGFSQVDHICRFHTEEYISVVEFISPESIICGTFTGTIQGWNIRSELIMTYQQHVNLVCVIEGDEKLDLLFISGYEDRTLHCWRLSTGELLHRILFAGNSRICSILLHVPDDLSTPITVGLRFDGKEDLLLMSCLDGGRRLERLKELKGVEDTAAVTTDGFQILNKENTNYFVTDYFIKTGDIRRQEIDLDYFTKIEEVVGMGKKYCLLKISDNNGKKILALFEKRDDIWKLYKESLLEDSMPDCLYTWLLDVDWLDGFRPSNTKGITFAMLDEQDQNNKISFAYWK